MQRAYGMKASARMLFINWAILSFCLVLTSCSKQSIISQETPLFILFPKNTHVFEDISPVLYEAIHQQFLRTGFALADKPSHAYQLITHIISFDTIEKNVSPEIILLSYHVRMTCKIRVLNYAAEEVFATTIACETLINKPRNPSFNDDFIHYGHQQLATRAARLIQQKFLAKLGHIFSSLR
jgi:hypothetical protein